MSAHPATVLRSAAVAAFALSLCVPALAQAAGESPEARPTARPTQAATPAGSAHATAAAQPSARPTSTPSGRPSDTPRNGAHSPAPQASAGQSRAASNHSGTPASGDPAGNNGTIKIDFPAPADSGHANRPHPGCSFQLRMFNFDDDQTGTITFEGQAPTKLGTLLTQHRLLSDDPAGGGQDVDQVYSYTAADLGLIGQPQAKQGWHIKVSVDADNAPGGAKHKVFWLQCPPLTASPAAATFGSGRLVVQRDATTPRAAGGSSFTGGSARIVANTVHRAAVARPFGLPFTGAQLTGLVALALAALAGGVAALRAGRRRDTGDVTS